MNSVVHVVGAGLAGLSAAVALAQAGRRVRLYEAAKQAGGRCRSYLDSTIGCPVDNGNHLLVSGNPALLRYIGVIGATATLEAGRVRYPFIDLRDGKSWQVTRNPLSIPGLTIRHLYDLLFGLKHREVVGMKDDDFHRRFLAPLIIAALNTEPEQASAPLAAQILRDTFARGAVRPYLPRNGLSASLIDPALVYLEARGGEIAYGLRLRRLERRNDQVTGLHFAETVVPLRAGDRVILATPATVAGELVEGLTVPDDFRPIVNVHFAGEVASPDPFIGLVGGLAEWVFFKPGHVSITVSAATRAVEETPERIAARCWDDLLKGGLVRGALPLYRVVKEKRATFAATPVQLARRPAAATPLANLFLAGDYTATGWPATMESAVRSGQEAARRALQN